MTTLLALYRPGLATLLVLEDEPEWSEGASLPMDTVGDTTEGPT